MGPSKESTYAERSFSSSTTYYHYRLVVVWVGM